jgi:hypothetical protein
MSIVACVETNVDGSPCVRILSTIVPTNPIKATSIDEPRQPAMSSKRKNGHSGLMKNQ